MKRLFLFPLFFLSYFFSSLSAQENPEWCCTGKTDSVVTIPHVVMPFGKYHQKVTVAVRDGRAFFEGDIDLGPIKELMAQANETESGVAIDGSNFRWTNATIPYTIGSGFSTAYQTTIQNAINYLDAQTNLCLVPRTNETNYVTFQTGDGCSSSVGMRGGQQFITLSESCSLGSVVHEICHAAGFYHEHTREDRNNFVTINWSNIEAGKEHNFNQQIANASDYGNYDYYAIMHYPRTAFAVDNTQNTITATQTLPASHGIVAINPPINGTVNMGQRLGMTQGEINTMNGLYPTTCSANPCNPPATPSVSSIQATTATVSWGAVSGVTTYRVEIKRSVDATWTNLGNATGTSRSLTGLLASTTYQVRVFSVCSSTSTSVSSNMATFTTLSGACNPPGTPSVSSIQATTATVSWGAVSGVTTYRVELKRSVDATWTNLGNATGTSRSLTGLLASTTYQVRVFSVCSSTSTSVSSNMATFTTLSGACNPPGTPSVSSIQATTATVSWGAVSGVTTYRVEIKRSVDATWTNLGNATGTSRSLTGLLASTTYQVRVFSVCSSTSTSVSSNMATFTTLSGACNPPGTPSVSSIQATTATVSWGAVSGVTTYRVEIKRSVDATWTNLGNATGTSRSLTGLLASTTYQVRVFSVCSSTSTSVSSNMATFTTLSGTCNPPGTPSVSSIQATTATVSWGAVSGAGSYRVELKRSVDATWTNLGTTTLTSTGLINLVAATTYQVRIFTICTSGSTSVSSNMATFTTLSGTCNPPGTPSVSSIQATTATVSWGAVSGVTTYRVEIKRTVDATWTNLGNATGTSRSLTGLLASTAYQVRVFSVCSSTSTSVSSNMATFTTLPGTCNPPGTPSVSSIQATTVTVSWGAVSGAGSYRVELKRSVDATWTNLGTTTLTSTGLINLVAATTYQVRIFTICTSGSTSVSSNIATFTTLSAPAYDNPCGALTFTPLNSCVTTTLTNVGAGATTAPAIPPSGCGVTNIKDVWFRCQSPSTGKVYVDTYPGTLTDGVIGLYFGNSCSALSYYDCWDVTGSDEMPDIWASIAPGNWIYLRYWGYDGLSGTFPVCVRIAPASATDALIPSGGLIDKSAFSVSERGREESRDAETGLSVRLAPNPVHEALHVRSQSGTLFSGLQVTTADGRTAFTRTFSEGVSEYVVSTGQFAPGLYFVQVQSATGERVVERFVKE